MLAAWQAPVIVAPVRLEAPRLVAGADGSVFLAAAENGTLTVRGAPAGSPFAAPQALGEGLAVDVDATGTPTVLREDDPMLSHARRPVLAVAPSGAAVVAWLEGKRLLAAVREPGAPFGPPQTVSRKVPGDTRITPAIGARGDVLLAWTPSHEYYLPGFAAVRRPGGTFAATQVSKQIGDIVANVGGDGTAQLAFTQTRPKDPYARTETRVYTAPPNSRRFARQTLKCDGVAAATVAATGKRLVLCGDGLDVWEGIRTLRRTQRLHARKRSAEVTVDLAANGRALVSWATRTRGIPTADRVTAALRPPGGTFGAPVFITPQFDSVVPVASKLTADGGAVVLSETFGSNGRSMLLSRYAQ